jgi:hypothetical protein
MPELATEVEKTVREAETPIALEELIGRVSDKSPSRRTTRNVVLALLDRGILVLDWSGKLRIRTLKQK